MVLLNFLVGKVPLAYNVGRLGLNSLRDIVSTYHLLIKYSTTRGVGEDQDDQALARHCYVAILKGKKLQEPIDSLDLRDKQGEQHVIQWKSFL